MYYSVYFNLYISGVCLFFFGGVFIVKNVLPIHVGYPDASSFWRMSTERACYKPLLRKESSVLANLGGVGGDSVEDVDEEEEEDDKEAHSAADLLHRDQE